MAKNISWRKFVQKLRQFEFVGPYAGGRHLFMKKEKLRIIIPNPHRGDISGNLVAEILDQAGISSADWENTS